MGHDSLPAQRLGSGPAASGSGGGGVEFGVEGVVASKGGALVVRNPISKHAAERLAERGITESMARKAIEKGTRYYDRMHGTVAHVLEKGMVSGKTLQISTNPATGNVTTGIIRSRFNPDVLLPDGTARFLSMGQ